MVTAKVDYNIKKSKKLNLTTKQWCNYHGDYTKLKKLLAKENNVNIDDINIVNNLKITNGKLNFDNLDE